jgi:holo-[acyl-carrier protein] synthase
VIAGIGTDIVRIERIAQASARTHDRFAQRILTPDEFAQWAVAARSAAHLAKRWAMKEAFAKACGHGIREPLTWQNLWITHDLLGRPSVSVAPWVQKWLEERKITRWHISVSDEAEYAVAFAVVETV